MTPQGPTWNASSTCQPASVVRGTVDAPSGPLEGVNSGFEAGTYPWKLGGGSARASTAEPLALDGEASSEASIEAADGAWLLRLAHDAPGWQALLTGGEPFFVDAAGPYTVSLYARPSEGGVGGTFLRVEARDEYGAFLARAGRGGWTTGDEGTAGGRWYLPVAQAAPEGGPGTLAPQGTWERFVVVLESLPEGTSELRLTIGNDTRELGTYGLVDAIQIERGDSATEYVPGPSAGLRAYLGPLVPRLLALRDPLTASGGRISMWYFSLELASLRPFLGYGFGVVEHLAQPEAPRYVADPLPHPHSFYLQLLLEGGALLLVAVLAWLGMVAWWLARAAFARGSWAAVGALAGLVALLVQSVFDPVLAQGPVLGLWWVMVCSAVSWDATLALKSGG